MKFKQGVQYKKSMNIRADSLIKKINRPLGQTTKRKSRPKFTKSEMTRETLQLTPEKCEIL